MSVSVSDIPGVVPVSYAARREARPRLIDDIVRPDPGEVGRREEDLATRAPRTRAPGRQGGPPHPASSETPLGSDAC